MPSSPSKTPQKKSAPRLVPQKINSPAALRQLHRQMLTAIRQPLTQNYQTRPKTADGKSVAALAAQYIKPNDRLTASERLGIYNRQYWFRLLDCLTEDYPGLRAILGDRPFDNLTRLYLQKHPSKSYSLCDLGQRLPAFLAQHPKFAGPHYALAIDMARFEWAQVIAFDSAQLPPLSIDALLGQDPAKLTLTLQPYITLLELDYPVDDFVLALRKEVSTGTTEAATRKASEGPTKKTKRLPKKQKIYLAVHRLNFDLYYKRLDLPAFRILTALAKGVTLQKAILTALKSVKDPATFQSQLQQNFSTWAQLKWFAA